VLFLKQLERAERDVQTWPDYVKQALIKPEKMVTTARDDRQRPGRQAAAG
jgi:hypothetical protein